MSQSSAERKSTLLREESRLQKYANRLIRVSAYIASGAIAAMMLLMTAHAIGRYAFKRPIAGEMEISSVLLVTAAFLSLASTQVHDSHVKIGTIVDKLSERKQKNIDIFNYLFSFVMAIFLFWQAIARGIFYIEEGSASPTLLIPDAPFLFIVAFGSGIFAVALIMHLVNLVLRGRSK